MLKKITSLQNPLIKNVFLLQEKSKERKKQGRFVVEGSREIALSLKAGYQIETLFVPEQQNLSRNELCADEIVEVPNSVFEKIAIRGLSAQYVAVVKYFSQNIDDFLPIYNEGTILVVDGAEKPGNLGAILRTADGLGAKAVFCSATDTDKYNPNIVRSSLGACFTVPFYFASNEEILQWLTAHQFTIYATFMDTAVFCNEVKFEEKSAIVLGSEANGVSEFWQDKACENVLIPMSGSVDSLNLSVSAAILLYEAVIRQQKVKKYT